MIVPTVLARMKQADLLSDDFVETFRSIVFMVVAALARQSEVFPMDGIVAATRDNVLDREACMAKRARLRQYSQHPPARCQTSRLKWAEARGSPIITGRDAQLCHQGGEPDTS